MKSEDQKDIGKLSQKAVIYLRSAAQDDTTLLQFDHQKKELMKTAEEQGYEVTAVHMEIGSFRHSRPELERILESVKQGNINAVFVTSNDRISRNLKDLIEFKNTLEKYGVELIAQDDVQRLDPSFQSFTL